MAERGRDLHWRQADDWPALISLAPMLAGAQAEALACLAARFDSHDQSAAAQAILLDAASLRETVAEMLRLREDD